MIGLTCTVAAGMKYSTIENVTNCESDDKISLAHDGKAWLLDFWATWCPPCQAPMAHNQKMLETKEAEWAGNVRIIGLSIDKDRQIVDSHVKSKGWEKVEHFHRSTSNCSDVYGVRGVPHIMLIDKAGTIVFKGHPAGRTNLEDDLSKLGRGEELEGQGIEKLQAGDAGAVTELTVEEGFEEKDMSVIDAELANFKTTCAGWQLDSAVQEAASGMMRSFCVIVLQSSYNPSN
jgi:thiol-disulfide isomerase/thioredoxin